MHTLVRIVDTIVGPVRLLLGIALMLVAVSVQLLVLVLLAPSRNLRIRACNYWGKLFGPMFMWLSGCRRTYEGLEHLDGSRPAIYISNHTSIYDILLAIFLSPVGTVGVAKKEVVWYPFFGLMYLLSGHLRLDRKNRERAIASMESLADIVDRYGLSIYIWPEGTRARDGRLLPFKKGLVHLAKGTGLPIVPIVISGAHLGWEKGTLLLGRHPIHIKVLPAHDTSRWSVDTIEQNLDEIWQMYVAELPDDQKPAPGVTQVSQETLAQTAK